MLHETDPIVREYLTQRMGDDRLIEATIADIGRPDIHVYNARLSDGRHIRMRPCSPQRKGDPVTCFYAVWTDAINP